MLAKCSCREADDAAVPQILLCRTLFPMARRKKRAQPEPAAASPPSARQWLGEALGIGLLLMAVSMLGCGLLGLLGRAYGFTFAIAVIFLAGTGWAASRVGAIGALAGIFALTVGVGATIEAHHLRLAQQSPTWLQSVRDWQFAQDGFVVQTKGVIPLPAYSAHATVVVRRPKNTSHTSREVTPLVERTDGPVVAFACLELSEKAHAGTVLVDIGTYDPPISSACEAARTKALLKLRSREVASGAADRFVYVFADEAAWSGAPRLRIVLTVAAGLLSIYWVVVLLFRRRLYEHQ